MAAKHGLVRKWFVMQEALSAELTIMPVLCDPLLQHATLAFRSARSAGTVRGLVRVEPVLGVQAARADALAYLQAHPRHVMLLTRLRVRLPQTYTVYGQEPRSGSPIHPSQMYRG